MNALEMTWTQWQTFYEHTVMPLVVTSNHEGKFEADNFYGYAYSKNGVTYTYTYYLFGAREFSVYDGNVLTVHYAYQPYVCADMWKEWHKEVSLVSLELGAMV